MRSEQDPTRALKSLAALGLQLAEDSEVGHILHALIERGMEVTGAHVGVAFALGFDGEVEKMAQQGLGDDQLAALTDGSDRLRRVLAEGHAVRIDDVRADPSDAGFAGDGDTGALLGLPLRHVGQIVGALILGRPEGEPPFSDEDEEIVAIMGSMAAVGIENARLLAAESERLERGSLLRAIASRVRRSLETSDVLAATVQALGRAANVDRCFIRLVERKAGEIQLGPIEYEWAAAGIGSLTRDPDAQYPVTTLAATLRSTQWSDDVAEDRRLTGQDANLEAAETRAVLATPLEWGDELLGVVTFHSTTARRWTPSDIALLEAAAREVSIAIDHARRYGQAIVTADRLRELDQMRSDFVSMVSHELRSPMTVIAGISDILEKRHRRLTTEQRKELVETLGREARRLRRLVSEVLDLEAFEKGALELQRSSFDVVELAREAVADAIEAHRTTVISDVADAHIDADRDRIKQVLLNLISNASKFSEEDQRITVRVADHERGVVVSVSDEGPGMSEDQQARLFERFSRVHLGYTRPGSGLGLFLCKKIVEEHGGHIWVESSPGKGSTFFFALPR